MNLKKILYSLLGYSRSERVGSFVLIIVVVTIIVFRLLDIRKDDPGTEESFLEVFDSAFVDTTVYPLFEFDPNTVSYENLLKLGLSGKQANTLVHYRESGAVFFKPDDFRKVYGIPLGRQDSLIPYIVINRRNTIKEGNVVSNINKTEPEKSYAGKREELFIQVEINSADTTQMISIPGIGEVLGPRIVKYRALLGGFHNIMQLSEVYGLDSADVEAMRVYISLDTALIKKINLNSANYSELIRHPYITKKNTEDILNYRKNAGHISSLKDLRRNNILSKEEIDKLNVYFYACDSVIIDQ